MRSSDSAFMTMPGEQKPHCDAPAATKLSAHRARSAAGRPSWVLHLSAREPGCLLCAGHDGLAVDEHGAGAARAFRGAAVLYRRDPAAFAEHVKQALAVGKVDGYGLAVKDEFHDTPLAAHGGTATALDQRSLAPLGAA